MTIDNEKKTRPETQTAPETESAEDRAAKLSKQAQEGAAANAFLGAEADTTTTEPETITPPQPERKLAGALEKFSQLNFVHILGDHNSAETYARTLGEEPERDAKLGSREELLTNLEERLKRGEHVDVIIVNQHILNYNTSDQIRRNEGLNLIRQIQKLADKPEYTEALKNTKIVVVADTWESEIYDRSARDQYSDPSRFLQSAKERSPHVVGILAEDDYGKTEHLAEILEHANETLAKQLAEAENNTPAKRTERANIYNQAVETLEQQPVIKQLREKVSQAQADYDETMRQFADTKAQYEHYVEKDDGAPEIKEFADVHLQAEKTRQKISYLEKQIYDLQTIKRFSGNRRSGVGSFVEYKQDLNSDEQKNLEAKKVELAESQRENEELEEKMMEINKKFIREQEILKQRLETLAKEAPLKKRVLREAEQALQEKWSALKPKLSDTPSYTA